MSDLFELAASNPYAAATIGNYQASIATVDNTNDAGWRSKTVRANSDEANNTLSFQDMLLLMVTQLQNQTIDNTMDTSDMMNQIIQMTVMQGITDMRSAVKDMQDAIQEQTQLDLMSYAASLIGQTVTVGLLDKNGNFAGQVTGRVDATGVLNGQQVIFINGECYYLSQVMAVGELPEDADLSGGTGGNTDTGTEPGDTPGDDFDAGMNMPDPEE